MKTTDEIITEMEEYKYIDIQRAVKFAKQIAKAAKEEGRKEERERIFEKYGHLLRKDFSKKEDVATVGLVVDPMSGEPLGTIHNLK